MPSVSRQHPTPRAVTNAVGAGFVHGPATWPEDPIPVVVQVSWDGAPKMPVPGLALGWVDQYVRVRLRDAETALSWRLWMRAEDVSRG